MSCCGGLASRGDPLYRGFDASGAVNGFITLTLEVTGSTRNRITLNGVNVPFTTDTTAVVADPGTGSHRYVLVATNAAGASSRTVTVTRNLAPDITNFQVRYVSHQLAGAFTNAYFSADWVGWPRPVFEIDYGQGGGFVPVSSRRITGTIGGRVTAVLTYAPGFNGTARLRATNSQGTDMQSVAVRA